MQELGPLWGAVGLVVQPLRHPDDHQSYVLGGEGSLRPGKSAANAVHVLEIPGTWGGPAGSVTVTSPSSL
jgi:hypothetical protein